MSAGSTWAYGSVVTEGDSRYWCLRSEDIPITEQGRFKIPVLRLGWDDGASYTVSCGFGYYDSGGVFDDRPVDPPGRKGIRVVVRETDWHRLKGGTAVAAVAVEDWPHKCPRCQREKSAYLGLNEYDCRWGCYGRPQQ